MKQYLVIADIAYSTASNRRDTGILLQEFLVLDSEAVGIAFPRIAYSFGCPLETDLKNWQILRPS